MSNGDGVDVCNFEAGVIEGLMDDGLYGFNVRTGGDLWDYATISSMNIDLGDHDVGEDMVAIFDDGGGGFVARAFYSEDAHSDNIIA